MSAETLHLGNVDLYLLPDAEMQLDGNRVYYPAEVEEWGPEFDHSGSRLLDLRVCCLLIQYGSRYALVDTGFGREDRQERGRGIEKELEDLGIENREIEHVIITHAHGDHVLGNTFRAENGWEPMYPNALYHIQKNELDIIKKDDGTLWNEKFAVIEERGSLRPLDGRAKINDVIGVVPSPGHTLGHQSVLIMSEGKQALYTGDLAITAGNMEHPEWGPEWAWSHETDVKSRQAVAEWAISVDAVLIFGHEGERPFCRLSQNNGSYSARRVISLEDS